MVNDKTTLNGALNELGEVMATNLTEKGIDSTAEEGLTTLVDKINDISCELIKITLRSNKTILYIGDTVTFTAKLNSALSSLTSVELFVDGNSVGIMEDVGDNNYQYNLTLTEDYWGSTTFEARLGDFKSNILNYPVMKATEIKITEIIGLRYNSTYPDGFVYDGDKITIKGVLEDYKKNRVQNEPVYGSIKSFNRDTCVTDINGEFSLDIIVPVADTNSTYNILLMHNRTEYYESYIAEQQVQYIVVSSRNTINSMQHIQALINNARGNEIHLTHDYTAISGDEVTGVAIPKDMTIWGHGFSIDGQGMRFINSSKDLIIHDLTIKNCISNSSGGAINHSNGKMELYNCNFENNKAGLGTQYQDGGCIYSTGASLKVVDSTFQTSSASDGGAIAYYNETGSSIVELINSKFINNTSYSDAGAGHLKANKVIIKDCVCNSNTVNVNATQSGGGAFCILGINGVLIENSVFKSNQALNTYDESGGGALYIYNSSNFLITGCTFTSNFATRFGGAIITRCGGTVSNSTFLKNHVNYKGGVAATWGATVYYQDCIILECNSIENPDDGESYFFYSGSHVYVNNNWYGSNSTNKNTKPISTRENEQGYGIHLTSWIYVDSLDLTINEGTTSKVKFDFNHTATATGTSVYDASNLPECEFVVENDVVSLIGKLSRDFVNERYGITSTVDYTAISDGTDYIRLLKNNKVYATVNVIINR